jgi:hypothetical protein
MKNNSDKRRSQWMADFENTVVALDDKHRGKIDWNTASHFFNIGQMTKDAAEKYVATRKDQS